MAYSITSTNYGVYLSNPATQTPATVVSGAYVTEINGGDAIFGNSNAAWNLTNLGTIKGTGATASGIYLSFDGVVTNAAGGQISGTIDGVFIGGNNGTVTNAAGGRITGGVTGVHLTGDVGSVTNSGTIFGTAGVGIALFTSDSSVINAAGGLILGVANAVTLGSTHAVVSNFGTIQAIGTSGDAVFLPSDNGYVTNNVGGSILGVRKGIEIDGKISTITNSGTISATGTDGTGVAQYVGSGHVINLAAGSISGYRHGVLLSSALSTVSNSGTIAGTGATSDGVSVAADGGFVTNDTGGRILAVQTGVLLNSILGSVSNAGTISGTGTIGVGVSIASGGGYMTNQIGGVVVGVRYGVYVSNDSGSVTNFGTVLATGASGQGVKLGHGTIVNNPGAVISGELKGISVEAGSVTNSGTVITGTAGIGIYVDFGNVTNTSAGVILASGSLATAVFVQYGTFVNSGVVQGRVFGVELAGGAGTAGRNVTLSGTVVGATGISVAPGSTASQTVSVSGSVSGTSGTAVALTTGGSDRLIVAPGAVFHGKVDGGGGKSVVEVAASPGGGGAAGADDGSAATAYVDLGSVTNFSALQVDPSAAMDAGGALSFDTLVNQGRVNLAAGDSLVVGTVAGAAGAGTIDLKSGGMVHFTGPVAANQTVLFRPPGGTVIIDHPEQFAAAMTEFAATDLIDLPLGAASFQQYSGGFLSLSYNGGSVALQLSTLYAAPQFLFTGDGAGGTDILVSDSTVCFCRGTMILTERGEVAVEALAVGDRVETLAGAFKPIRWIGFGRDLVTRANKLARPVIVRAGALADNVPVRDLYLTHGHALYLDSTSGGVLVPVENLINHRSILWDETARVVEYYHVELEDHDVVLANGAPAESYYDAGNRARFHNMRPRSAAGTAKPTNAPVLNGGPLVEAAWDRLFERSGGRIAADITEDPDLHLIVAGRRLDAAAVERCAYRFAIDAPPGSALLLRSRSGVPSLLGISAHDHRRLGIALACVELRQPGLATIFAHDAPLFGDGGCHPPETGYAWTDGELELPAALFAHLDGAFTLTAHIERPGMRYPRGAAPLALAA